MMPLLQLYLCVVLCSAQLAKRGIVNDMTIRRGLYRIHVERLAALITCVNAEFFRTSHRFFALMRLLPIDLQEVVANRVYGCNRNVVVAKEGIYWALKLGPKYEDINLYDD
jgi:hypothetical protein